VQVVVVDELVFTAVEAGDPSISASVRSQSSARDLHLRGRTEHLPTMILGGCRAVCHTASMADRDGVRYLVSRGFGIPGSGERCPRQAALTSSFRRAKCLVNPVSAQNELELKGVVQPEEECQPIDCLATRHGLRARFLQTTILPQA
jgi:hypothetical protein